MIKTARLRLYMEFGDESPAGPEVLVRDGLKTAGLTFEDIKIDGHTHWGNWVLVPIRHEYAQGLADAIVANGGKARVDMEGYLLEESDIEDLEVGDKVTLQLSGIFANSYQQKGTVVRFEGCPYSGHRYVVIRKYRSRSRGWRLKAGDNEGIWRGW